MSGTIRSTVICVGLILCAALGAPLHGWGAFGHQIASRAASAALPEAMTAFFRNATDQLAYLNPEPDRWRDRAESTVDPALANAFDPDHYIDMEIVPAGAFDAVNRYEYLAKVTAAGRTAAEVGTSPYRMLEVFQRLRSQFRAWRSEPDARTRGWMEQRIINDAGILGHYVTDASNPLHTTVHHNAWIGANPHQYAGPGIHSRFESRFVSAHVTLDHVRPLVPATPRVVDAPRKAILDFVRASHALVEQVYQLDKRAPFGDEAATPEHRTFAAERLAVGAQMLRDLWWTAWVTSTPPAPTGRIPR